MIKAKIKKTKSLSKFSPPIEEGSIFNDAKFSDWPEVGHSFSFFDTSWGDGYQQQRFWKFLKIENSELKIPSMNL